METQKIKTMLNKVPQITLFFWVIKVLCTTVGETVADYLNSNLHFGLTRTSILMSGILAIALFFQFKLKKYVAWVYWLAVALLSVVGTLITDNLTDNFSVPLPLTTVLFSFALGITLFSWYKSEKTLSIHSITSTKREVFYWLTILFTFALGTASGDLLAEYLHLGYLPTGILILAIISIISLTLRFGLNSILGFWTIYILTRPLGASIGDYLSQSTALGGLGLGTTNTSFLFLSAIFVCVMYLVFSKKDQLNDAAPVQHVEKYTKPSIVMAQTAGMVIVFIILGVVVYGVHQVQVSKEPPLETSANKPLGDLSEFRKIAQDTLSLEKVNNTSQAQTRITDLETTWDQNQSKLKPTSPKDWTKLDGDVDLVLKTVPATNPDPKASANVLNTLLSDINSIDAPSGK